MTPNCSTASPAIADISRSAIGIYASYSILSTRPSRRALLLRRATPTKLAMAPADSSPAPDIRPATSIGSATTRHSIISSSRHGWNDRDLRSVADPRTRGGIFLIDCYSAAPAQRRQLRVFLKQLLPEPVQIDVIG